MQKEKADKLARAIQKYIIAEEPVLYETIEARARERGISDAQLFAALDILHTFTGIERRTRGDSFVYMTKVHRTPKERYTFTRYEPYPVMDSTNDCDHPAFAGMDFSYLVTTREERLRERERKGYSRGHGRQETMRQKIAKRIDGTKEHMPAFTKAGRTLQQGQQRADI